MLVASTAMLVALSLSGCFAQETPDATSSPVPSQTPVFATEEEALAAATEAYEKYLKVSDAIFADMGRNPERLLSVATREQYERELVGYKQLIAGKLHGAGQTHISTTTFQQFDNAGAVIYACVDLSDTDLLNSKGESQVPPKREDYYATEVTLVLEREKLIVSSDIPWAGQAKC